jgi:hypothetical protein
LNIDKELFEKTINSLKKEASIEIININQHKDRFRIDIKFSFQNKSITLFLINKSEKLGFLTKEYSGYFKFKTFINELTAHFKKIYSIELEKKEKMLVENLLKTYLYDEIKKDPQFKMQCLYNHDLKIIFDRIKIDKD